MTITRDEIRDMAQSMMDAKRAIDEAWKEGKRDGPRLQVYALAGDVLRLLDAVEKDDPYAYKVAATEAREHAGNASFHAICWVNKAREVQDQAAPSSTSQQGE